MDITAIPTVSGAPQSYKVPAATGTAPTSQQQAANGNNTSGISAVQQEYEAAAKAAAATFNYPLGSKIFSIYKDVTGQFVTRYVSLIDGSVTYVPAPVYMKPMQLSIDA